MFVLWRLSRSIFVPTPQSENSSLSAQLPCKVPDITSQCFLLSLPDFLLLCLFLSLPAFSISGRAAARFLWLELSRIMVIKLYCPARSAATVTLLSLSPSLSPRNETKQPLFYIRWEPNVVRRKRRVGLVYRPLPIHVGSYCTTKPVPAFACMFPPAASCGNGRKQNLCVCLNTPDMGEENRNSPATKPPSPTILPKEGGKAEKKRTFSWSIFQYYYWAFCAIPELAVNGDGGGSPNEN